MINFKILVLQKKSYLALPHAVRYNPDIDVRHLIEYGKTKNVDIVLWVLWKPLDENMTEILETYQSWGAKGDPVFI